MNSATRFFLMIIFIGSLQQCQPQTSPVKTISVDEVFGIINDSARVNEYVVFDTRDRMDYIRGHLVSAFWLSPDSVESKVEIIRKERRPIIIYDSGDVLTDSKTLRLFRENDVTNFFLMKGGFTEWTNHRYPAAIQLVRNTNAGIDIPQKYISAAETYALRESPDLKFVIIDIRPSPAFKDIHIKDAISVPYVPINEFVVNIEEHNFPRDTPIILYGDRSSDIGEKAAEVMFRNDFTDVFLMQGGIEEWQSENYPIAFGR